MLAAKAFKGVSVVLTILHLILQFTPVTRWYAVLLSENWTESDGEVLIVLSADEQSPDLLGFSTYWRCVYAVRAWRSGHFRALIVSGGKQEGTTEPRAVTEEGSTLSL